MVLNIGLIISGGSSKGAYQIGFFKALKRYCDSTKVCIQSVSATSIGAINAYAFISDKLDMVENIWLNMNSYGIWKFRRKVREENFLQNRFDCLINEQDYIPCDFFITLSEMSTMTPRHFNLRGAMNTDKIALTKATITIPMLTGQPLKYKDKFYFDGGVTNNIPFEPILNSKLDLVIVLHFTPEYRIKPTELPSSTPIVYFDMTRIEGFIKGNFNFRQEDIRQMIKDGELYSTQILEEYFNERMSHSLSLSKDSYYYLSAGRLLNVLNRILMIGKSKRVLFIKRATKILFK